MSDLLLPWTTRGVTYDTRAYLSASETASFVSTGGPRSTDFAQHFREYGCFDDKGDLIADPSLAFRRHSP